MTAPRTFSKVKRLIGAALISCVLASHPAPAYAQCTPCACSQTEHPITRDTEERSVKKQHELTYEHIKREFSDQELWFLETFLLGHIIPYLQLMSQQFVTAAMHQLLTIGTMIDSKHQLDRLRQFNIMASEAQRDYHPSMSMCVVGTNVRSLAEADRRADFTTFVLSQRAQDRQIGARNAAGSDGAHYDLQSRFHRFKERYCDVNQNSKSLRDVCGQNAPVKTRSRDINFSAMIDTPLTLEIDFADGAPPTDDEIDIFALADNLYANELMTRFNEVDMDKPTNQVMMMNARAILAKRSVVQHSFNTLVGMKSMGSAQAGGEGGLTSADTLKYMTILLEQMGVPKEDAPKILGKNPSYYAQMDVLTRRMFQNPYFYAGLSEQPANTDRKSVALQAIELMQNFDTWESYLRTEAILSVWLEMRLQEKQQTLGLTKLQTGGPVVRDPSGGGG